ncbi:hypothetical protein SAMN05216360_110202 [Methylobacterium phyllostachyos]|uniref:Uncharacterized protein n=1 Tax=Methylobacterium phyllostachyos TaxID=582672 RepID=A0A1H0DK38_9HYPH|nr:hypothetical protein [Methylobacterium phyllostachyos]SDN70617.1 hypothetical protein SAMN05216360_110202 [Methylobacterium phyllostachyos]
MTSSAAPAQDPFAILGETLETAAGALDVPTAQARESAHRAAATTKRVVGSGVYSLSYALAYGTVFAATYVHDLLPEASAVRRGLSDGGHDALSARARRILLQEEAAATHARTESAPALGEESHANGTRGSEPHDTPLRNGHADGDARTRVDALAGQFEGQH